MREPFRSHLIAGESAGLRYVLAPPRSAPAGRAGLEPVRRAGSSLEFEEHRDYQPGDDLRRLDWSAYARTDRLVVKDYREETTPHLDLVVDGSRSMALAERKVEATLGVAAALASAAAAAGYSHSAWIAGARCDPIAHGTRSPSVWDEIDFEYGGSPARAIGWHARRWKRRGVRILVSDLLWPDDPSAVLAGLCEGASGVAVVMILGGADVSPDARGSIRLVDVESAARRELFVDGAAIERYRRALARHQETWSRAAKQAGAPLVTLVAEEVVPELRLEPLAAAGVLDVR